MDIGMANPSSYITPYGCNFDGNCFHLLSLYGSGNYRQCLKCKKHREFFSYFKCNHCHEWCELTSNFFIIEGPWTTLANSEETFHDECIYECTLCSKVSLAPELKTTEKWIIPNSNKL